MIPNQLTVMFRPLISLGFMVLVVILGANRALVGVSFLEARPRWSHMV